jgi:hypothetical protein
MGFAQCQWREAMSGGSWGKGIYNAISLEFLLFITVWMSLLGSMSKSTR